MKTNDMTLTEIQQRIKLKFQLVELTMQEIGDLNKEILNRINESKRKWEDD